jgi:hypothetical protein
VPGEGWFFCFGCALGGFDFFDFTRHRDRGAVAVGAQLFFFITSLISSLAHRCTHTHTSLPLTGTRVARGRIFGAQLALLPSLADFLLLGAV